MNRDVGRYCLDKVLGEGSTGIVYLANTVSGQQYALKMTRAYDLKLIESMRREIAVMQRVQHAGLVRLHEHGDVQGLPWYSMELLPVRTLRSHLNAGSYANCPLEQLLQLLAHIAEILAALHSQGYIHGDLKPENIFLKTPFDPVLGDLNLTFEGQRGQMTGTPLYAAPEQIRGEPLDARTDLYALGCISFEILTASPPFPPGQALLGDHLQKPAPDLAALRPDLPTELVQAVSRLMEKDRQQRYAYAQDVVNTLKAGTGSDACNPSSYHLYNPSLTGRSELLRHFRRFATFDSPGGCTLIEGTRGSGKTALARRLEYLLSDQGWRVVRCAAQAPASGHVATDVPLSTFIPVLQCMVDSCWVQGEKTSVKLFSSHAERLQLYVPGIADLPGINNRNLAVLPGQAQRLSIFRSLESSLRAFAAEQRLVLILDDLQWADELSLDFLEQLIKSGLAHSQLLVVALFRTEASERITPIKQHSATECLLLPALLSRDVTQIASEMLTLYPPPATLSRDLEKISQGNPLLLIEYLRLCAASGMLRRNASQHWVYHPPFQPADNPQTQTDFFANPLTHTLRRRLSALSANTFAWVNLLAMVGGECEMQLLTTSLAFTDAQSYSCLQELIAAQICSYEGLSSVRFLHSCFREHLTRAMKPEQGAELHLKIAASLQQLYESTPDFPALCGRVAYHLDSAGDPYAAIPFHAQAADFMLQRSAYRRAIFHYRKALDYSLAAAGEYQPRRGCWWYRMGIAQFAIEDLKATEISMREALLAFGVTLPRHRLSWLFRLLRETVTHLLSAPRKASVDPPDALQNLLQAAAFQAQRYFLSNDAIAMYTLTLLAANRGKRLDHAVLSQPYAYLAHAAGVLRLHRHAERYFRRSMHLARQSGQSSDAAFVSLGQALYYIGCGRINDARQCAENALAAIDPKLDPLSYENHANLLANICYVDGHFDQAYHYVDECLNMAEANDNEIRICWACLNRVRIFTIRGEFERAMQLLEVTRGRAEELQDGFLHLMIPALSGLLHFHLGQRNEAFQAARTCHLMLQQTFPTNVLTRDAYMAVASTLWKLYQQEEDPAHGAKMMAMYTRVVKKFRVFAIVFPMAKPIYRLYRSLSEQGSHRTTLLRRAVDQISLSSLNHDLVIAAHYATQCNIELDSGFRRDAADRARASNILDLAAF